MAKKSKITIHGKGETGDDIKCKIEFDPITDDPIVSGLPSGVPDEVLQSRPVGMTIIEEIVGHNPTWVKIGGKWYRIG